MTKKAIMPIYAKKIRKSRITTHEAWYKASKAQGLPRLLKRCFYADLCTYTVSLLPYRCLFEKSETVIYQGLLEPQNQQIKYMETSGTRGLVKLMKWWSYVDLCIFLHKGRTDFPMHFSSRKCWKISVLGLFLRTMKDWWIRLFSDTIVLKQIEIPV